MSVLVLFKFSARGVAKKTGKIKSIDRYIKTL